MNLALTPIKASRKLLAVLASHDTTDFEQFLRPNAYLQVWSENGRETFVSSSAVSQALRCIAKSWSKPTVNVESWDETEGAATVSFQIWGKEQNFLSQHQHVLTVALHGEQIDTINLYHQPISQIAT